MDEWNEDIKILETVLEGMDEEIVKLVERMKGLEKARATFVKVIDELRTREDCCKEAHVNKNNGTRKNEEVEHG